MAEMVTHIQHCFGLRSIIQRQIIKIRVKYPKKPSSVSFKLQSLTSTKVVSETERTLAVFQGSDTLGSISNMLHYYSVSNSGDKQGHETKCQKVTAWRTNRAAFCQQTLHLSFHLTTSAPSCWCIEEMKSSARWPAAKAQHRLICFPDTAGA